MASIRLENVSRRFGADFYALRDVSAEIGDREVITIVGPSGCGKSTLLRIIAGLDFPTSGHIWLGDEEVNSVPARSRNIAMVFQSYALYPHMTCYENLALNLQLKRIAVSEIDQRVRETARMLEIEDLLQKKPRELSGGQRQRVAVGRALIRKPRVFLFDEPLSNLDALLRERVRHELKELFKKIDATVVYVTHDQVEAMTLADRVLVLDHGRIQQVGTPAELYWHPENSFVGAFIGSPAMNIFDGFLQNGACRLGPSTLETTVNRSGPVTVGIRPEAIKLGSGMPARVSWVETLGAQLLIGAKVGDVLLIILSSERSVSDSIQLSIDSRDVHVFDKDSGQSLRHSGHNRPPGR